MVFFFSPKRVVVGGCSYRKLLDFRLPKDPVIVKAVERAGGVYKQRSRIRHWELTVCPMGRRNPIPTEKPVW